MNDELGYPPQRAMPEYRPPGHNWGTALVVACLALGFMMSWAVYEMRQRVTDEVSMAGFRHDLDSMVAEQADLGRLLADPRTKLVRLVPSEAGSSIHFAAVAWNEERQSGIVFCDDLLAQGRRRYQVWLIPAAGDPTAVAFGPTEPGRAVYPFNATEPAAAPSQIVLTLWRQNASEDESPDASGSLAAGTVR
jgi:hypothetical protein